jgi:hypothetical protein
MKMKTGFLVSILGTMVFAACTKRSDEGLPVASTNVDASTVGQITVPVHLNYSFETGPDGWVAGYSDYRTGLSLYDSLVSYQMSYGHSVLPASVVPAQSGFRIRGFNRSDDLFMFLKRKVTGLTPNARYSVLYDIELASNEATNRPGVGGSPAEDVTLKAGASVIEPVSIASGKKYVMNIDKGDQVFGGQDMNVFGHIGVTDTTSVYTLISRNSPRVQFAKTNESGELWLIIGTDSGYEGLTELYYSNIAITLQEQ